MSKLYQVLYCSRNVIAGSEAEIGAILAVSRRNNARDDLTGGLLFSEGCFAQVLEGPMWAVTETFERIQGDERHKEVTVLQAREVNKRDFPNWSMGFAGTPGTMPGGEWLAGALIGRTDAGDQVLALLRRAVRENDAALLPTA